MKICRALLKYDYSNFSITILEYCSPDKCLIREKHYWDKYTPEYNIAKDPTAPMSGRKHSDTTKQILSDAKKGKILPNETKTKISDALKGKNHPNYGKTLPNEPKTKLSDAQPTSQAIEVTDIKNYTTTSYNSIREAARALNIHKSVIDNYFKNNKQKPYKGRYTFKRTPKN